jgi:adenylate cyclase
LKEVGNVFLPVEVRVKDDGSMPNPDSLHLTGGQFILGAGEGREQALAEVLPFESLVISIRELQDSARDSGHIKYLPNRDGIYRYYPTVINYQEKLIPSLALQVSRFFMDEKAPVNVEMGKRAVVAGRSIPLLNYAMALVNYCGEAPGASPEEKAFRHFSACDVLNGMVVVFGVTAVGLHDLRPTPFIKNTPGLEINANIIENVYTGNFLRMVPEYVKYLLIVLMGLSMWFLIPRLTPIQGTAAFFLILIGFTAVAILAFSAANIVISMTYPILSLLLTFLLLTTYKFRTEVKHSRYMKQMFQSVVAPKVVEEILEKGVDLAGEEKELTVMFSDIRGFTTYSEKHNPHEVVEILNEYLTQMTMVLLQTEGTLDKYIGDAIMAFWGAPGNQQDHAYRACSTALGMVDLLHTVLHPKWQLEGKEKLEIGIGLNTGKIVVGYVGSQFTRNYTLIGDPVNLGSRLEGTTKEYKVEIIISETTYEQVKSDMLCRELDLIQVKGKKVPIRIYELVDHRLRGAGAKEMKVKAFEEGLADYRARRFGEAAKRFRNCLELDPQDGPSQIFLERCAILEKAPPPDGWDGVFVMKSK